LEGHISDFEKSVNMMDDTIKMLEGEIKQMKEKYDKSLTNRAQLEAAVANAFDDTTVRVGMAIEAAELRNHQLIPNPNPNPNPN